MRNPSHILVTGGAGFIGSHFVKYMLNQAEFSGRVTVLDLLTYAADLSNLVEAASDPRYAFVHGDICDAKLVKELFAAQQFDAVVNFAAETHVDRAIAEPLTFIRTNVEGVGNLLECARDLWKARRDVLFHQVSTDEVFGEIVQGKFNEESAYRPRNPYAASKAAADHLVASFGETYGIPFTLSYASNNYGPNQYPEKLIPLMIKRIITGDELPLYGNGTQIREWLYVLDHVDALWKIIRSGSTDRRYAVSSGVEYRNLDLIHKLCCLSADELGLSRKRILSSIRFVQDRKGHDRRYALDSSRIRDELDWKPAHAFDNGLRETLRWCFDYYERGGKLDENNRGTAAQRS